VKPINLFYKFQNVVLNAKESWLYNEARFRRYYLKYPIESPAKIRERLGVTQEELAEQMGTSVEKVIEIENKGVDNIVWDIFYYFDSLGCWFNIQIEHDRKKITLGLGNFQEVDELT
jgi:DNA-binding XRE family transcriptional regulator